MLRCALAVPMIGRRWAATLPLLLLSVPALEAKPDFTQSTVTADPASVQEGDLVTFLVVVVNSGDQNAPHTEIDLELPLEAMFVGLTGFEGATVDVGQKTVYGSVDLPAAGRYQFQFRVIVPRDAGGRVLSPDLRVRNLFLGAEFYGGAKVVVQTKPRSDGVVIGPIRIAPAGLALLAVLTLFPMLFVFFGSRAGVGAIIALVIAIGFWTLFAAMAVRDYRSLRDWHEASCVIRDSRLRPGSAAPAERPPSGGARRETTTYAPLLALEYSADGRQMMSTGFDTGSRVSIGGVGGALEEFSRWPPGSTVPCWFDPEQPEDVVVVRGFGGAYLFALFPLPLFLFGAWAVVNGRRRRTR
jgi:hypothetical protein